MQAQRKQNSANSSKFLLKTNNHYIYIGSDDCEGEVPDESVDMRKTNFIKDQMEIYERR